MKRFTDTKALEVFLSAITLAFGLWLVSPVDTYANVRGFRLLAQMMPEALLGCLALAMGSLKLAAAQASRFTVAAAIVGAAFWAFMAGVVFPAQPYGFAGPCYLMFAIANLYIVARGG